MPTWSDIYNPTVADGNNIDIFQANYVPASQVLDRLAEQSGFWWKIDKDRVLHFAPRDKREAPFTLTADKIIGKPKYKHGSPLYRNVQYIKNTYSITDEQVDIERGDGEKQVFHTKYWIARTPKVEVSEDGGSWQEKDIGSRGIEENKEFYWERGSREITQDRNETPLSANDRVRITYIGKYRSITVASDNAAIEQRGQVEGTSGRTEDVITEEIEGREEALEFGNNKLAKYAKDSATLQCTTREEGLEAGQLLTVNLPALGISEDLLITRIRIRDEAGIIFREVEAVKGPKHSSWTELFLELKRRAETIVREGITADDILVIPFEYEKVWPDEVYVDGSPNIFRVLTPDPGVTWEEGFDTSDTWGDYQNERWSEEGRFDLFPTNDTLPSFAPDDRIKYIGFLDNDDNEIFRKEYASRSPAHLDVIDSDYYIGPEEFTGLIADLVFVGGIKATSAVDTGIYIDTIEFDDTKTELEAYQVNRRDEKEGDY